METLLSPPVSETDTSDIQASPTVHSSLPSIDELLMQVVEKNGSDLHLRVNEPPIVRVHGHLERLPLPTMTPEDTKRLMYSLMNEERRQKFERELESI